MLASIVMLSTGTCTTESLTVVEVDSIEVSPPDVRAVVGDEVQMQVAVLDRGRQPVEGVVVEWSSSEPSIASVNSSGVLVARSAGWTAVHATFDRVSGSATVFVAIP